MKQSLVISGAPAPVEPGPLSSHFCPIYYFRVYGDDVDARIRNNWLVHADSDWSDLSIERKADLVVVQMRNVTLELPPTRFVFDLSKSGNLISVDNKDNLLTERWEVQWEKLSGVWVPRVWRYSNKRLDGSRESRRTVTWRRSVVNRPLPEGTFSVEALRVPLGALVADRRLGRSWRFAREQEGAERRNGDRNEMSHRRRTLGIVAANAIALLLILGLLIWRRGALFRR